MQNMASHWSLPQICEFRFNEWVGESVIFFIVEISTKGLERWRRSIILLNPRFDMHLIEGSLISLNQSFFLLRCKFTGRNRAWFTLTSFSAYYSL